MAMSQQLQDPGNTATLSLDSLKGHHKTNEINYQNNVESDYTEKIEQLDKSFKYADNSSHYWGDPELSIFFGSPLYQEASLNQKLALNHLYWVAEYEQIAAGESGTIIYNQVTSGVFEALGGYETLCQSLELETDQERYHIHAFQKIGYKTKTALLGKPKIDRQKLEQSFNYKSKNQNNRQLKALIPQSWRDFFLPQGANASSSRFQYESLRSLTRLMLYQQRQNYSHYLRKLEAEGEFFPIPTTGYFGIATPRPLLQLFTFNWGSSPFLACQHYSYRFTGNMVLKNYEYQYFKRFKELDKKGEFIPVPTAVSYYHLLDESFHTTTSQILGRDFYQDFPAPNPYEIFLANIIIYVMQMNFLNGLCTGIPAVFMGDPFYLPFYYKLLRSPVFDFSPPEALHWLEKNLCQEHEGFHTALKYHQRLLKDLRRFFSNLDYLWPANRELRLMASKGSLNHALEANRKAFQEFAQTVAL